MYGKGYFAYNDSATKLNPQHSIRMENFNEYIRQGEPDKAEKAKVWKAAIGLQQVDGLTPSAYLLTTARQNIEGDISIEEVKQRLDTYYQQLPATADAQRTEEADKVSARIAEILGEQAFVFSPVEYLNIHRRLFEGLYPHAGKIRDYNITKKEWVLDGETVLYATAENLKATLEYDFEQERKFNYKGLGQQATLEHLADFTAYLWQIHVFGEGNTRATALFLIKYLRTFGFEVNNTLFEQHSWYFRNALVRAIYRNHTKNIHATNEFLLRFFENLLLGKSHPLKNRELHIASIDHPIDPVNTGNDLVNDPVKINILHCVAQNPRANYPAIAISSGYSVATVKRHIQVLKKLGYLERIGSNKSGHWKITKQYLE